MDRCQLNLNLSNTLYNEITSMPLEQTQTPSPSSLGHHSAPSLTLSDLNAPSSSDHLPSKKRKSNPHDCVISERDLTPLVSPQTFNFPDKAEAALELSLKFSTFAPEQSVPEGFGKTRRKEQNRNAQRAFRQRKERQMQELQDQVDQLKTQQEPLAAENRSLKALVSHLQAENQVLNIYKQNLQLVDNLLNTPAIPSATNEFQPQFPSNFGIDNGQSKSNNLPDLFNTRNTPDYQCPDVTSILNASGDDNGGSNGMVTETRFQQNNPAYHKQPHAENPSFFAGTSSSETAATTCMPNFPAQNVTLLPAIPTQYSLSGPLALRPACPNLGPSYFCTEKFPAEVSGPGKTQEARAARPTRAIRSRTFGPSNFPSSSRETWNMSDNQERSISKRPSNGQLHTPSPGVHENTTLPNPLLPDARIPERNKIQHESLVLDFWDLKNISMAEPDDLDVR